MALTSRVIFTVRVILKKLRCQFETLLGMPLRKNELKISVIITGELVILKVNLKVARVLYS